MLKPALAIIVKQIYLLTWVNEGVGDEQGGGWLILPAPDTLSPPPLLVSLKNSETLKIVTLAFDGIQ